MEKEICQQINSEIISKISSNFYAYMYSEEETPENKVILRYQDFKVTLELQMDLKKNYDGIISDCSIRATITEEKRKISRRNVHE